MSVRTDEGTYFVSLACLADGHQELGQNVSTRQSRQVAGELLEVLAGFASDGRRDEERVRRKEEIKMRKA